jgi:K+-sensing histidine kinase KdpD
MIFASGLISLFRRPQASVAERSRRRSLRSFLDTLMGALLCALLAATFALVGQTWGYSPELLTLFIPVPGAVARLWGFAGAMLGLALALVVFRVGLFAPIGSLAVASADARTVLFWVMLGSGVAAYVFARPRHRQSEIRREGGSC